MPPHPAMALHVAVGDAVRHALIAEGIDQPIENRGRVVPLHRGDHPASRQADPIEILLAALDRGASLIFFPEGTRNMTDQRLLPFRSGLYHLASARPQVELVPVWIDNLNRVLPKGEVIPLPLLCAVTFGAPLSLMPAEEGGPFRERSRAALLALAPAAEEER